LRCRVGLDGGLRRGRGLFGSHRRVYGGRRRRFGFGDCLRSGARRFRLRGGRLRLGGRGRLCFRSGCVSGCSGLRYFLRHQ
jgi:hypothetical protein